MNRSPRWGDFGAAAAGPAARAAGLAGSRAGAQVTQAQCGNVVCYDRRTQTQAVACALGCVCCVYPNGNSRCRPLGDCSGTVVTPTSTAAPTTTAAPAATTAAPTTMTTTTTAPLACGGAAFGACPAGCTCSLDLEASAAAGGEGRFACIALPFSGSNHNCADFGSCPDGEICTLSPVCRAACPAAS